MPKEQGYEFIMAQWTANECHFTPLINFQAHGENAPSAMTVVYFDDLLETNKVALEMVEIDVKMFKFEEAKFLIHLMKEYYLRSNEKNNDEKYSLLNTFNYLPHEFKHSELIKQLEKDNIKIEQFKVAEQKQDQVISEEKKS